MPFTIAHPVAVLPLIKPLGKLAIPAALIIGSMSPDFAYFFPFPVSRLQSHSFLGIFWYCLPVSLLSYVGFYLLYTPLVHAISPNMLSSRFPSAWGVGKFPKVLPLPVFVSIVIGAITHIIWDSFTHPHGLSVQMFSLLEAPIISIGGYTLYWYKVLQHGSTLIGLCILFWLSVRWFRVTEPSGIPSMLSFRMRTFILVLIFIPSLIAGVFLGIEDIDPTAGILIQLRALLAEAIFSGGSLFVASFTLAACVLFLKNNYQLLDRS